MIFEKTILPFICIVGVLLTIAWGARCERQRKIGVIRKGAFDEAAEALRSLSKIAFDAADRHLTDGGAMAGIAASEARRRAYYYDRAASIVRSIPAERA